MAFKEESSIEQCIILTLFLRFQKRSQICLENCLCQHPACMRSRSQRTFRRNLSSLNCQISLLPYGYFYLTFQKASQKFSRDSKLWKQSQNANFEKVCSASQCSIQICPLETPTRIQVTYFKLPARISRYVKLRLRKQSRTRRLISIEIEVVTRQCLKNCKSF